MKHISREPPFIFRHQKFTDLHLRSVSIIQRLAIRHTRSVVYYSKLRAVAERSLYGLRKTIRFIDPIKAIIKKQFAKNGLRLYCVWYFARSIDVSRKKLYKKIVDKYLK